MRRVLLVDTEKIKEDWGSVKRFCKEHGINFRTYHVVKSGYGSSQRIESILNKYGYINGTGARS